VSRERPRTTKAENQKTGFLVCAEEDSNLHPLSVDQALNLVTRVSYPSYASISSRTSGNLDASDAMDDLDVAAMLPRAPLGSGGRDNERYRSHARR